MSELDEFFGPPYVDVDEWREAPQRHRYIHGGFDGTDTRFSIYFPPAEQYEGRGFTHLEGGWAGNENTMQTPAGAISGGLLLPFLLGGLLVESNQGHFPNDLTGLRGDVSIQDYRATAEATRFAVTVAAEMYGAAPHHLYVYGGSGGGHRSVRVAENTGDLFAGAVPFMVPLQQQAAVAGGARNRAARFLHRKIDQIIDAVEPGGSGDPFEGLDAFERQTLAELYRSGYPRGSEFLLYSLYGSIAAYGAAQRGGSPADTSYVEDFWTTPGYLGHDRPELFAPLLVDSKATVARVATRGEAMSATGRDIFEMRRALLFRQELPNDLPSGLLLDGVDHARLWMGDEMEVLTGKLAGRKLSATAVVDGVLYFLPGAVSDMAPGDEVRVDNRNSLAQLWHEMYIQDPDAFWDDLGFPTYAVDGVPTYPQRTIKWDPGLLNFPTHTGRFPGKMIMLQHAQDSTIANPFSAHAYHTMVERHLGDGIDDQYRLWYVADAHHMPPEFLPADDRPNPSTKLINAGGILARALAAIVAWVENDAPPVPTTSYRMSGSLQLDLASSAADRSGLQAVTRLAADGAQRCDVPARTPVTFTVEAELPPGAGAICALQWNFDGGADWSDREMINAGSRLSATVEHVYELPGTYFPAVRVLSAPEDRLGVDAYEVQSLARARVVVS